MSIVSIEKALAALKEKEVWPFWLGDVGHGTPIQEGDFYGFYDSGGVTHTPGHGSEEAALDFARILLDDVYSSTSLISTNPEQLGAEHVTVLSGRKFVDRLYVLMCYNFECLEEYGQWSNKK